MELTSFVFVRDPTTSEMRASLFSTSESYREFHRFPTKVPPATPSTENDASFAPAATHVATRISTGSPSSVSFDSKESKVYPPASGQFDEVVQSSDLFWEKLKEFHAPLATKFKIPNVGGKPLDLHQLFVEVTSRGGMEKVIRERQWKEVVVAFNFPSTITSASFVLRKYYFSLLSDFEKVYYFRKEDVTIPTHEPEAKNRNNRSAREQDANQFEGLQLAPGDTIIANIVSKCDEGYVFTVNLVSEVRYGFLYHQPESESQTPSEMPDQRHRKRARQEKRDPARPKSNRTGYNFFFAEKYASLKPLYYGQERSISKQIGHLWSNLPEDEKKIYLEKGVQDKERYETEMVAYRAQQQQ